MRIQQVWFKLVDQACLVQLANLAVMPDSKSFLFCTSVNWSWTYLYDVVFSAFDSKLKCQFILLFNTFLLLFKSFTAFFDIIYKFYCTISTNFYLYLQYFQQKNFNFSKINRFQTDLLYTFLHRLFCFVDFVIFDSGASRFSKKKKKIIKKKTIAVLYKGTFSVSYLLSLY